MTILAIHTGDGLTKDMYENVRKEVNWEANPPPGLIFHAASFDKSGNNIRVADAMEQLFKHSPETFFPEGQYAASKDANI
jgi:hypothetical protein